MQKPTPGRSEMQNPPQRDSGTGAAAPGRSRLIPTKHTEKGKVNLEARGLLLSQNHPTCPTPWATIGHETWDMSYLHVFHTRGVWDITLLLHL